LALAVAATSIAVPPLILSWSRQTDGGHAPSVAPPASAMHQAAASPTASLPPTAAATPSSAPSAFWPVRIAAADPANTRIGVLAIDCAKCSAGSRVQYLGQGHALIVYVRKVPVGSHRTLTIVYECAETRTLYVSVSGDRAVPLTLSGNGSWTSPARVSIPIDLPAGDTDIKFFNPDDPAPDLDQILIT
jgi:hypothetical protein